MIFGEQGFDQGRWAGGLAKRIASAGILMEIIPKARVWRASWQQMQPLIAAASTKHWLEIVAGLRFAKAECLRLQLNVLDLIRRPLQAAEELYHLVQRAVSSRKDFKR